MIMVAAGSGIAPFRAFLEERAAHAARGGLVSKALLFYGCKHPGAFLHRDILSEWAAAGIVDIRPVFSRAKSPAARDAALAAGALPDPDIVHVQHRLWAERADVTTAFKNGARVFLCGDAATLAPAVRDVLLRIANDSARARRYHETLEETQAWLDFEERTHGHAADVFT